MMLAAYLRILLVSFISLSLNACNKSDEVTDNTEPQAVVYTFQIGEESTARFNVLANDYDPDQNTLNITGFTQPGKGTVSESQLGLVYFSDIDFNGSDVFSYSITDGRGGIVSAQMAITVMAVNDLPLAGDDVINADENGSATYDIKTNGSG